ncbi:MAG: oxidoreductase [Janthinobacterium lividum]
MAASGKWTAADMPTQAGKTVLVTGANSGIGYQAALELARHGAHVLLGCRSESKGNAALDRLKREVTKASVEIAIVDMASLSSIRAFASQYVSRGGTLDILVNNAGVMAVPSREFTSDGFERQFGTNHLGHFALTGLLMPALSKAVAPRVVTVASLAHRDGKIELDNLQSERSYKPWDAYNNSKLANILFAKELDRRMREAGSSLLSVAVHPGVSKTGITETGPGSNTKDLKVRLVKLLGPLLMQNDAMGALPTEYAATSPDVHGGEYIGPDGMGEIKGYPKVVQPRPQALDEASGKKLWERSEQLTGVVFP